MQLTPPFFECVRIFELVDGVLRCNWGHCSVSGNVRLLSGVRRPLCRHGRCVLVWGPSKEEMVLSSQFSFKVEDPTFIQQVIDLLTARNGNGAENCKNR
jgi:hypothetical protein